MSMNDVDESKTSTVKTWSISIGAALLVFALSKSHGAYHESLIWFLPVCLTFFAVPFYAAESHLSSYRDTRHSSLSLAQTSWPFLIFITSLLVAATTQIVFFGIPNLTLPANHEYYEPSRISLFGWIQGLNLFALIAAIGCLVSEKLKKTRTSEFLFALVVLALGSSFLLDLSLSPRPWIDVWTVHEDAVSHLLNGKNPYSQNYASIYPKSLEDSFLPFGIIFVYLPGVLYLMAPFKAMGLDVRVALVFAHIASALFLKATAARSRSPLGSYVPALLFLALPFAPYFFVMGWNDSFTVLFVTVCAYGLVSKSPKLFLLSVLGLALIKPHIALVLPVLLWYGCKKLERPFLKSVMIVAGIGLLLCAPFLLSDWRNFLGSQYGLHSLRGSYTVSVPERLDSFNLLYFLKYRWGFTIPYLTGFVAVGSLLLVIQRLGKRPSLTQVFLGCGISLLALFMFAPSAFLNYYWVVLGFIFASLALQSDTVPLDSDATKRQTSKNAAL